MQQVVAVVVTHDRLDKLRQCLQCLQEQIVHCDVLVVDNASADGTAEWLAEQKRQWAALHVLTLPENTGGAGGFNSGMRQAVETGYSYVWLMDDDCFPRPDALEKLIEADRLLGGPENYGFLSSMVLWTDGSECLMNRQKPLRAVRKIMYSGFVQVEQATFVSLLIPARTVYRVGLPIREYFIWGDDIEYTRRIAIRYKLPSYLVKQSKVVHDMASNKGSSIATDDPARLERYRLACRNECFTYRQEGFRGMVRCTARRIRDLWRILWQAPNLKQERMATLFKGVFLGFTFRPGIELL